MNNFNLPIILFIYWYSTSSALAQDAQHCKNYSNDPCECIDQGCLYLFWKETCEPEDVVFAQKLLCRRPNTHYAISNEIFCKFPITTESESSCKTGSTIFGINANGKDYEDEAGLKYKEDISDNRRDWSHARREGYKENLVLKGVSNHDAANLYASYVYGSSAKQNTNRPLIYQITITQDGSYELLLKFFEPHHHNQANQRAFDVRINNIHYTIVDNVDIAKLGEDVEEGGDRAVDISILFLVFNHVTTMQIKGYSYAFPIFQGFQLQFAYGGSDVNATDKSYIFSAFNLITYGTDTVVPDSIKKITSQMGVPQGYKTFSSDQCKCLVNGCFFDSLNATCIVDDLVFENQLTCRRRRQLFSYSTLTDASTSFVVRASFNLENFGRLFASVSQHYSIKSYL